MLSMIIMDTRQTVLLYSCFPASSMQLRFKASQPISLKVGNCTNLNLVCGSRQKKKKIILKINPERYLYYYMTLFYMRFHKYFF